MPARVFLQTNRKRHAGSQKQGVCCILAAVYSNKRKLILNLKNILCFLAAVFCTASVFSQNKKIPNGTLLLEKTENYHTITIRHYEQDITIDGAAEPYQLSFYDSPIAKNIIGTLQQKDRIHIFEIHIIDSKDVWFKFLFGKEDGYIIFNQNYYDFYNGTVSWIFGGYLQMKRDGPKYWRPEAVIRLGLEQGP